MSTARLRARTSARQEPKNDAREKLAELQKIGQEHIAAAKAIAEEFSDDLNTWPASARERYEDHVTKAGAKLQEIKVGRDDIAIMDKTREISDAIGEPIDAGSGAGTPVTRTRGG